MNLLKRAQLLEHKGIFLGGPPELFVMGGRKQLIILLSEGLMPTSKVLDVGCGCLRAGYWLIHFLDRSCYFGIEPNTAMLRSGIEVFLEPEMLKSKAPRFDSNARFDFTVFEQQFEFCLARSIWTHASKRQIRAMLDGFVAAASPTGVFLTSYKRPFRKQRDYRGDSWIGRSHESDMPGMVRHRLGWIRKECAMRGLSVKEIKNDLYDFGGQRWLRIRRHTN